MTVNEGGLLVGLAFALGAIAGSWVTLGVLGARHAAALRRMRDDFQRQTDAVVDQFRSAQQRSQAELERVRLSLQRQLAAAADEPQAAVARAEARLRKAYDEIDRLRHAMLLPDTTIRGDSGNAFADTRPMVDGM